MLISYFANKKSSPRLPSWQPSLISFNTPIDSGSIIKPCTLKHFQVPILAPGLLGREAKLWIVNEHDMQRRRIPQSHCTHTETRLTGCNKSPFIRCQRWLLAFNCAIFAVYCFTDICWRIYLHHYGNWLELVRILPCKEPYAVKPVYNDHLMGYFSAFWSSDPEGRNC